MGSIPDSVTLTGKCSMGQLGKITKYDAIGMGQLGKITEYDAIGNGFDSRHCNFVLDVFNESIR